jgi:ubiquinone biosynthesis protein
LSNYGLDWLAHSKSPWRIVAYPKTWFKRKDRRTQAERLRLALEELGTTYIKLGQALSTRTDLVPPEYVAELVKLQDDAPPVDYKDILAVLFEETGELPESIFAEFEEEPIAAASIGQVHNAVLVDGSKVVVKIQRPNVIEKVEEDLEVLRDVAAFVAENTQIGSQYDVKGLIEEFAFTLMNELDYRREGINADRFRENFKDDPTLHVPKVYWRYTSQRVITMERIEGIKIDNLEAIEEAGINRQMLAQNAARIVLTEIFKHGFFHADPHPGNFFVMADGSLTMIDTGMVGRLDEQTRDSLMRITLFLAKNDAEALVDELLVLGMARGRIRRSELKIELDRLIQIHMEGPPELFSLAMMFQDTLATAAQYRIAIPSDLLFLARAIAMCEGVSKALYPEFRFIKFAESFLEDHYRETRSPKAFFDRGPEAYVELAELARDLPRRTRRLFGQFERGEVTITARIENIEEILRNIQVAANRLSISFLIAGLIGGLSVLTLALTPAARATFVDVFLKVLLTSVILFAIMFLASVWRSRKPMDDDAR